MTLQVGDVVVTMSYPGVFTVLDIKGDDVTIATTDGMRKVVRLTNVRRLNRPTEIER